MDFTNLKNFMDHLTSWRIPGNDCSVFLGYDEVFRYQSGFSDMENNIKMDGDRMFNIYSCSKITTVTAGLQLLEKGVFLLDDPISEYIPEFSDMNVKLPSGEIKKAENPITMRHLFTMTSGLTYGAGEALDKAKSLTDGKVDTVVFAKCLAENPLAFEPGEKWQYSYSHDVLGAVIEVISGMKFRDYVQKNIFEPCNMTESMYHPNEEAEKRRAVQYTFVDNSGTDDIVELQKSSVKSDGGYIKRCITQKSTHELGSEFDSGGAGIVTSVSDYIKLLCALANGGVAKSGERILSSRAVDLMRTNQLSRSQMPYLNWSQLKGYGYGLGVRTMTDKAVGGALSSIGEFGWGGAAGATAIVDPSLNLAVFYTHHMHNPQETYYQPRLRNAVYSCLD